VALIAESASRKVAQGHGQHHFVTSARGCLGSDDEVERAEYTDIRATNCWVRIHNPGCGGGRAGQLPAIEREVDLNRGIAVDCNSGEPASRTARVMRGCQSSTG
jgi:hypothetical protein